MLAVLLKTIEIAIPIIRFETIAMAILILFAILDIAMTHKKKKKPVNIMSRTS